MPPAAPGTMPPSSSSAPSAGPRRSSTSSVEQCVQTLLRPLPRDQVKQRIEEDPHHVHKVPVQAGDVYGIVIFRRILPLPRVPSDDRQQPDPDRDVDGDRKRVV